MEGRARRSTEVHGGFDHLSGQLHAIQDAQRAKQAVRIADWNGRSDYVAAVVELNQSISMSSELTVVLARAAASVVTFTKSPMRIVAAAESICDPA